MKAIQTIVVDDNEADINHLVNFIIDTPALALRETYTDPLQALMNLADVQLIFLDVEMEPASGLQILKSLTSSSSTSHIQVVLTTSGGHYAVDGFDYDVADFLKKPFDYERFATSVQKVKKRLDNSPSVLDQQHKLITIKILEEGAYVEYTLNQQEIIYIEVQKNNTYVFTTKRSQPYQVHQSLTTFQEKLSKDLFVRIHRSYIVNMRYIEGLQKSKNRVLLANRKEIPMGELYADEARARSQQYRKNHG